MMFVDNPSMNKNKQCDMVADKKIRLFSEGLFPIRMMKDILDNTCGVVILKMIFVVVIEGSG